MSKLQVIDDYISKNLINAIAATWPNDDWPHWHRYNDSNSQKLASMDANRIAYSCPAAMLAIGAMAELRVNHPDAFPDLDLHGAGLHAILPNGALAMHLDGSRHPVRGWRRVCNAVLFVDLWWPQWGGDFELCDSEGNLLEHARPSRGRIVLFDTNDTAWHRVAKVVGPNKRRTVSLFWWQLDPEFHSDRTSAEFRKV